MKNLNLNGNYYEGLPAQAYLVHPGPYDPGQGFKVIKVVAGEPGYYLVPWAEYNTQALAQADADERNGGPLAPAVAEAMLAGSMFGWLVPAADPATYRAPSKLKKG
jgi:hypothetical protein